MAYCHDRLSFCGNHVFGSTARFGAHTDLFIVLGGITQFIYILGGEDVPAQQIDENE